MVVCTMLGNVVTGVGTTYQRTGVWRRVAKTILPDVNKQPNTSSEFVYMYYESKLIKDAALNSSSISK